MCCYLLIIGNNYQLGLGPHRFEPQTSEMGGECVTIALPCPPVIRVTHNTTVGLLHICCIYIFELVTVSLTVTNALPVMPT